MSFVAIAFGTNRPAAADEKYEAGKVYFGREKYIEYQAGSLPIILAAPHGGRERPEELPNRVWGTFAFDVNTQELARAIALAVRNDTGQPIHVVICRLHRTKIDCNREIKEGSGDHELTDASWREYHAYLDAARKTVVADYARGLFIDLHGHGHMAQHLEIGYLHPRQEFLAEDDDLNRPELATAGSLRALATKTDVSYAELLRGPTSFGGLIENEGYRATPAPKMPHPPAPYYSGRYSTQRHGRDAVPICGLQLETHWHGLRDTVENRNSFSVALARVLREYFKRHLRIDLPKPENDR